MVQPVMKAFAVTVALGSLLLSMSGCGGARPSATGSPTLAPELTEKTAAHPVQLPPIDPRVQETLHQFNVGEYEVALPKLRQFSQDFSLSVTDRRTCLEALAEFQAASQEEPAAIQTVSLLLREEPPVYAPDPDAKPLEYLRAYYVARKQKMGSFGVERADPGVKTIAVMDFHNASITADANRYDRLQVGLPQLLMFQFQSNVKLKVVERARLDWLMGESKIQNDPAVFDASQAVRVGKMLGAHAVVFGTFMVVDRSRVRISARLVKVETSEVLMTENIEGNPNDLMDLADQLAVRLARRINENETIKMAGFNPTQSLDAMLAYAEGLEIYHTQGPDLALEKFRIATQLDPKFELAKQKVTVIEQSRAMAAVGSKF